MEAIKRKKNRNGRKGRKVHIWKMRGDESGIRGVTANQSVRKFYNTEVLLNTKNIIVPKDQDLRGAIL